MDWKRVARDFTPRAVLDGWRALRSGPGTRFSGPYASWEAAASAATGYDDAGILEKVRLAALAIRRGEGAFERDSVVFASPEPLFPQLAVMRRAARDQGGRLSVLDFGGSLGSSYGQCREFLTGIDQLRWSVVEQPAFVACGRREFETEELRFFDSIEDAARAESPNVAMLSSVLQYLSDPAAIASRIAAANPGAILLDRTPVHEGTGDLIVVQRVPPGIYRASYPMRIFGRARLHSMFGERYAVTAALPDTPFESLERQQHARYIGLVFERVAAAGASPPSVPAASAVPSPAASAAGTVSRAESKPA